MYERFTDSARGVMNDAKAIAAGMGANSLGTEHILLALIAHDSSSVARLIHTLGRKLGPIREAVIEAASHARPIEVPSQMPLDVCAKKAVQEANFEATEESVGYVGPEHLLLGLFEDDRTIAGRVLRAAGMDVSSVRTAIRMAHAAAQTDIRERMLERRIEGGLVDDRLVPPLIPPGG